MPFKDHPSVPSVMNVRDTLITVQREEIDKELIRLIKEYVAEFEEIIERLLTKGGCVIQSTHDYLDWSEFEGSVHSDLNEQIFEIGVSRLKNNYPELFTHISKHLRASPQGVSSAKVLFIVPNGIMSMTLTKGKGGTSFFRISNFSSEKLVAYLSAIGESLLDNDFLSVRSSRAFSLVGARHLTRCILLNLAEKYSVEVIDLSR